MITLLRSPHCIPLTERESTGLFRTLADVTVRSRCGIPVGRHPPRSDQATLRQCRRRAARVAAGSPRSGQPRVLASRETPLHGWRTDPIVPTARVSSPLSAPSPMEVEGGRFVRCSVGTEDKPAGGRAHTLTEQLLADSNYRDDSPGPDCDHGTDERADPSGFPTDGGTCGP